MSKKIVIVAGESSGDFHSALLISALKRLSPEIKIGGIGGERMRTAGAEIYVDIAELAIMGFTDVLANLPRIRRAFKVLLKKIDAQPPQAVVLVDYPGFNLKLAREVKKRNIPVIYYISPQIWAWGKGRIKTIKQFVDKMIVLFKFEETLYQDYGFNASFVGHPLLDIAHPQSSRQEFLNRLGLSPHNLTLGLVPGSRRMEVERILPLLLESARLIQQKLPQVQFILLKAPALAEDIYTAKIEKYACRLAGRTLPLALCKGQTYDFLNACDFVLVASGTATLETAIMQKPMLVVYKVSFWNWLIARLLVKVPYIGLVNLVAGKKIVPEFIQFKAKPSLIAQSALKILGNQETLANIKQELAQVRQGLGSPGASQRAAEIITNFIG